jgi:hypothetical protein
MRRTILFGFLYSLVAAFGFLMISRALVAKPQPNSRQSAASPFSKETDTRFAPTFRPPDGTGNADDGAKAGRGAREGKAAAVAHELESRLSALSVKPQMREMVARRMAQEYAELFRTLHLSAEKEELLAQIVVDRFFSVIGPERDSYDRLAQDLLEPDEFKKYAAYRDELPVKAMIKEVAGTLQIDTAGAASEEIGRAIRSSSNRASRYWTGVERRFLSGELNEADLSREEQNALSEFDLAVAREVRGLSDAQLAMLREWFRNSVRTTVASIRQGKGAK